MLLKNKTILVTGADGFIGSHLTEDLIRKNAKTDKIKDDIETLTPTLYNSSDAFGNSFTEWYRGRSGKEIEKGKVDFHPFCSE